MRIPSKIFAVVTGFALLLAPFNGRALAAKKGTEQLHLKAGDLSGVLLSTEAAPVKETPLTLLDSELNTVATTVTDADGKFAFAAVASGEYQLRVVKGLEIPMLVDELSTQSDFKILVPEQYEAGRLAGLPLVLVILGSAVLITTVVVVASGDDDDDSVSP